MSGQPEVPSSKEVIEQRQEIAVGMEDGSGVGDSVQDQVILAPEIMRMILEYLDLRALKKVRLVCKSWLREAQIHVERRGVVCLDPGSNPTRIQDFIEMRQRELTALPQPFKSLHVYLGLFEQSEHPLDLLASQLSILCPPLSITRFFPTHLPLDLAFSLILQFSTSLVDLELNADTCEAGYLPFMDPDHIFPKLKCLEVKASVQEGVSTTGNHFPSIVAWIVKSSPNLDNYGCESESWNEGTLEMVSELVLKVDVKNVKTLTLVHENISNAASEHLRSIPFTRLQDLSLRILDPPELTTDLLIAALPRVLTTLRVLDVYGVEEIPDDFPVCPNVQEIDLFRLEDWIDRIPTQFPSFKALSAKELDVPLRGEDWNYNTPLCQLKEFTVWMNLPKCRCNHTPEDGMIDATTLSEQDFGFSHSQTIRFFDTFPQLESLNISDTFVLHCCRLKASGDPRFENLMKGVKHLKMKRHCECWNGVPHASDYSSLSVLKELESIEVELNEAITSIPTQEMSGLKVLRFLWDESWRDVDKLLEIARGVEKVVVTNCCTVARVQSVLSTELLNQFFESAPNAGCCRE